jgi:hypothetical protein
VINAGGEAGTLQACRHVIGRGGQGGRHGNDAGSRAGQKSAAIHGLLCARISREILKILIV